MPGKTLGAVPDSITAATHPAWCDLTASAHASGSHASTTRYLGTAPDGDVLTAVIYDGPEGLEIMTGFDEFFTVAQAHERARNLRVYADNLDRIADEAEAVA